MDHQVIRVGIIDDHPVVRAGSVAGLSACEDMVVAWAVGDAADARDRARGDRPDVALMDLRLGNDLALDLIRELRNDGRTRVLVLSAFAQPAYVSAALEAGAAGYVLKSEPLESLAQHIRVVAEGGHAISAALATTRRPPHLTLRDRSVLRLLVEGRSNDEIGRALGLTEKTVESYLRVLFRRTRAATRTELAMRAMREGWLDVAG